MTEVTSWPHFYALFFLVHIYAQFSHFSALKGPFANLNLVPIL